MGPVPEADRVERIFERAAALGPSERKAFLDATCGEDRGLREELESLLEADESAGDFLAHPALGAAASREDAELSRDPVIGRTIGAYKLLAKIGQGGMSSVYLAARADDRYRKRVAIKLVPLSLANPDLLRRFRTERHILASLDHPNIAKLYDAGTTGEGLPYFVMEYIEGEPIDLYCSRQRLSIQERLGLFCTVCEAVQYAHDNLVVHRDLKSSNILISARGEPKLLDFGIAKLLNPELTAPSLQPTLTWHRVLTPEYASPEQVEGRTISPASDVYSLGVLLYKLLTGRLPLPIHDRAPHAIERVVLFEEPEKPSAVAGRGERSTSGRGERSTSGIGDLQPEQLQRRLAGDLDKIILKTLRKEPRRRYASPRLLCEDIQRHLAGLPVRARKPTLRYRTRKFLRRHRAAVGVAVAFVVLLALAAATTLELRHQRLELETIRALSSLGVFVGPLENGYRVYVTRPIEPARQSTFWELLRRLPRMTQLELSGVDVLSDIDGLRGLSDLHELSLSDLPESIDLEPLHDLVGLRRLEIDLPPDAVSALKKALPSTEIVARRLPELKAVVFSSARDSSLDLSCVPMFQPGYRVGIRVAWNPVPGAAQYNIRYFRKDACGQATEWVTTNLTSLASGYHPNCGAPESCYLREATVLAIGRDGSILADNACEICEIGQP